MKKIIVPVFAFVLGLPAVVPAQQPHGKFLAVDIFGGVFPAQAGKSNEPETGAWDIDGWDIGGTVRFLPWLGVNVSGGRHTIDGVPTRHLLVGPRVTTGYEFPMAVRFFAHALAGFGSAVPDRGPSASGNEVVLGVGSDLFAVARIQFDYVRLDAGDRTLTTGRAFVGLVAPLCFRRCSGADGFNLSGRPSRP